MGPTGKPAAPAPGQLRPERPAGTGAAGFGVGQVVPLAHRPSAEAIRGLAVLVQQRVPAAAAGALRDPRILAPAWSGVLARELATMLGWAARRRMAGAGPARSGPETGTDRPAWAGGGAVLALMPRHGHAVHLLRRAVPFAMCGIPVRVAGHATDRDALAAAVDVVAELLGLAGIAPHPEPARTAVGRYGAADLVVLTGSPASLAAVRAASQATVLGATGGCVTLVGGEPSALRRAAAVLATHDQPDSCTRFGGWWLLPDAEAVEVEHAGDRAGVAGQPPRSPVAAHPSAVYRLTTNLDEPPRPYHGYTCLPCDEHGVVGTLVGFGRDPVGGWPGDFLV